MRVRPSNRRPVHLTEPLEERRLLSNVALLNDNVNVDKVDDNFSLANDASFTVLRSALEDTLGHDINSFDIYNPADVQDALTGADLVVIPELIDSRVLTDPPYQSLQLIRDFVANGGGFISVGGWRGINARLMENLFGYSQLVTTQAQDVAIRTPQADVTEFGDAAQQTLPATPEISPIFFFDNAPWNVNADKTIYDARTIYKTSNDAAAVALLPYGGRRDVGYIGVSYGTFDTPTQLSNWTDVLKAMVIEVVDTDVPDDQPAPTNVVVDAAGKNDSLTVSWADNATLERQYTVSYGFTPYGPFTQTLTLPANTTSTVVTGLEQGRNYFFQVAAVGVGAAPRQSAIVQATIPPGGTPTPTPIVVPVQTPVPGPQPVLPQPEGNGPLVTITATSLVTTAKNIERGQRVSATLRITNDSTTNFKGNLNIALTASPDNVIGNDITINTVVKHITIKAGVTKRIKLKFTMPEDRDDLLKFHLVASVRPDPIPGFSIVTSSVLDPRIISILD